VTRTPPSFKTDRRLWCVLSNIYTSVLLKMHLVRSHGRKMQTVNDIRVSDIPQKPHKDKVATTVTSKLAVQRRVPDAGKKYWKPVSRNHSSHVSGDRGTGSASSAMHRPYPMSSGGKIGVVMYVGKQVSKTKVKKSHTPQQLRNTLRKWNGLTSISNRDTLQPALLCQKAFRENLSGSN